MKKQPFISEKSKPIAEKSAGLNAKINQIETDLDNETLHIATKPPKLTIKVIREENCNYAEHYPQRSKQVKARRNWVGGDTENELESPSNMSLIHFLEPEVIDEQFDIKLDKTYYRVSINRALRRFYCEKIISYNYKGIVLLKNPIEKELSEQLQKWFIESNPPKKNRLDTIAHFKKRVLKHYEQEELARQPKKKPVGKEPKANLTRATLWCIRNFPKNLTSKNQTLLLAYKKFGEKNTQTENSFVRVVGKKWSDFDDEYKGQSAEFKKQNSKENYARKKFRVPRNNTKQRIKKDEVGYN
jgi:hypothetical protein